MNKCAIHSVSHQGACSATTEWDGRFLMRNNFEYSKILYDYCRKNNIRFIYASSASVYGLGENGFEENAKCEGPINAYAFSKLFFDNYVRRHNCENAVGLRYFNVYGGLEAHKGSMASTIFTSINSLLKREIRLLLAAKVTVTGSSSAIYTY